MSSLEVIDLVIQMDLRLLKVTKCLLSFLIDYFNLLEDVFHSRKLKLNYLPSGADGGVLLVKLFLRQFFNLIVVAVARSKVILIDLEIRSCLFLDLLLNFPLLLNNLAHKSLNCVADILQIKSLNHNFLATLLKLAETHFFLHFLDLFECIFGPVVLDALSHFGAVASFLHFL